MPIRAEMRDRYPPEWRLISLWVRVCAGWRCEWCGAVQGSPTRATGKPVVLTVAHVVDSDPANCTPTNLAALCQACHLAHDMPQHVAQRRASARAAMRTVEMTIEEPA